MLMEPDEYTSQERALTDKAKELIEQHELDWGNGECFIQRDAGHSELYMTLEAPNHATVTVTVPAETDEKGRGMGDHRRDGGRRPARPQRRRREGRNVRNLRSREPGRPVEHCRYVCLGRSHTIKDPSEGASSWPD